MIHDAQRYPYILYLMSIACFEFLTEKWVFRLSTIYNQTGGKLLEEGHRAQSLPPAFALL
jgi:hypothetical protein